MFEFPATVRQLTRYIDRTIELNPQMESIPLHPEIYDLWNTIEVSPTENEWKITPGKLNVATALLGRLPATRGFPVEFIQRALSAMVFLFLIPEEIWDMVLIDPLNYITSESAQSN